MPLKRFSDWPLRLEAAIDDWGARAFAWGEADCAGFVCHVIQAMTGADLFAAVRAAYRDGATAVLAIRRVTGRDGDLTVEDAATHHLGPPLPSPRFAQRGDVVSVQTAEGPALGICVGDQALLAAPTGLGAFPMADWSKAWRI